MGSTDPDGEIVQYNWRVGGTPVDADGPTLTREFNSAGRYTVSVSVRDNQGKSATTTQSILVSEEGTARFVTSPTNPTVNESVRFEACGNSSTTQNWEFGDGTSATGKRVFHSFDSAGTYDVTLTLGENGSEETVTQSITVTAGAVEITSIEPQKNILPIAGYPTEETYEVSVETTETSLEKVEFELLAGDTTVDRDGSDGYTRAVSFENLAGPTVLKVTAVGEDGSTDTQRHLIAVYNPTPKLDEALTFICNLEQTDCGGSVSVERAYNLTSKSDALKAINNNILGEDEEIAAAGGYGYTIERNKLTLTAFGEAEVATPIPDRVQKYLPAEGELSGGIRVTGGGRLVRSSNNELNVEARPLTSSLSVSASVSADVPTPFSIPGVAGLEVNLNAGAELGGNFQIQNKTLVGEVDIRMNSGSLTVSGSALPQISAAICDVRAGPSVDVGVTLDDQQPNAQGEGNLNFVAEIECPVVTESKEATLATVTYPTSSQATYRVVDQTESGWKLADKGGIAPGDQRDSTQSKVGSVASLLQSSATVSSSSPQTRQITDDTLEDKSPSLTEKSGEYTAVWESQDVEKNVAAGHDIVSATRSDSEWSTPESVTDDRRIDIAPDITTSGNQKIVAWARANRTFTKDEIEGANGPTKIFKHMELAVATNSSSGWDEPTLLTDDSALDINPSVVATNGHSLITWTRDADADISTRDDRSRAYAVYDNGSLSTVKTIDADTVAASAGNGQFRIAYASGEQVTVGTADTNGAFTQTGSYIVNAPESNVTDIAIGPNQTAWIAGQAGSQQLQVATEDGVRNLSVRNEVAGLQELSLHTSGSSTKTLLTYRGRTPSKNGTTLYYQIKQNNTWVTDRGFASGIGSNLTVRDADTAVNSEGFQSVYVAEPVVEFGSSASPRGDIFSTKHTFAPDYVIDANATVAAPGTNTTIDYTLSNSGDIPANSDVTVEIVGDGTVLASETVGPLKPGEAIDRTLNATADQSGQLTVRLSGLDQVKELNTTNNKVSVSTGEKNLNIAAVNQRRVNDSVIVETRLANTGTALAEPRTLTVTTQDGELANVSTTEVASQTTKTVETTIPAAEVEPGALVTVSLPEESADDGTQIRLAQPDLRVAESSVRYLKSENGIEATIPIANVGDSDTNATVTVKRENQTLAERSVRLSRAQSDTVSYRTVSVVLPENASGDSLLIQATNPYIDANPADNGFSTTVAPVLSEPDTSPPTITNLTATNSQKTTIVVSVSADEKLAIQNLNISVDGPANVTLSGEDFSRQSGAGNFIYEASLQVNTTGTYTVTLTSATDQAGNQNKINKTAQVTVDDVGPPPVVGDTPPRDLNGDSLYRDLDGDGSITVADVQVLFANLNSSVIQSNVDNFDFVNTSEVGIVDVQELFSVVTENQTTNTTASVSVSHDLINAGRGARPSSEKASLPMETPHGQMRGES
jgi:PKD repeat protein